MPKAGLFARAPSAVILPRANLRFSLCGACGTRDQTVKEEERHLRKRA
jgi:hypothetical protein